MKNIKLFENFDTSTRPKDEPMSLQKKLFDIKQSFYNRFDLIKSDFAKLEIDTQWAFIDRVGNSQDKNINPRIGFLNADGCHLFGPIGMLITFAQNYQDESEITEENIETFILSRYSNIKEFEDELNLLVDNSETATVPIYVLDVTYYLDPDIANNFSQSKFEGWYKSLVDKYFDGLKVTLDFDYSGGYPSQHGKITTKNTVTIHLIFKEKKYL